MMNRIYLYLAKRNKQDLKLIIILQGPKITHSRLKNINLLRLQPDIANSISDIIYQHRIEWEPWLESANTYAELRTNMEKRGYRNLPVKTEPLHPESSYNDPHIADTRELVKKTMASKMTTR
jgi:hypothetical protein